MSITHSEAMACPCGAEVRVELADSLNADRHAHLKQRVLERVLHVGRCHSCARTIVVDHRFLYVDLGRRQIIGVFRSSDRNDADDCAHAVEDMFDRWFRRDAPLWIRELAEQCLVRAVFGLEELREKIVADDAGLDDLALEALKCHLMAEDPALRAAGVATLRLDRVDGDHLDLVAVDLDDQPCHGVLRVPRAELARMPAGVAAYAVYPDLAAGPHVSLMRLALSR
jgi:hypothetical protein